VLEARELTCSKRDRTLFEGLSLVVEPGELLYLRGPNGAGKTSLLRILAGLSTRYEGDIFWQGHPLAEALSDFRQQVLYLGHGAGIKPQLTPLENLRWSCALRGEAVDDERLFTALARVGLTGFEQQPCYGLSAGQQRRVNLARLFCSSASLWLLDEPFTAIDQRGVAEIEQWIGDFADAGGSVVLTTHHVLKLPRPLRRIELGEG